MVNNSSVDIETLVSEIVNFLFGEGIVFKNTTYMSPEEDTVFDPSDTGLDVPDSWDLIYDENENQTMDCNMEFPTSHYDSVVTFLNETFGEPNELRDGDPVWNFGRSDRGQLWIQRDGDKVIVDIRYYYEKV